MRQAARLLQTTSEILSISTVGTESTQTTAQIYEVSDIAENLYFVHLDFVITDDEIFVQIISGGIFLSRSISRDFHQSHSDREISVEFPVFSISIGLLNRRAPENPPWRN